ncbi:hypothetical protein L6452_18807 [Arctium lappa]|uniref:Uncharacterized protein n=1 Tax=Arctium lappa TaxID=4217 RepID=A0ACB9C788_ARCLA|nr:hypothetical protein L6452_18807 [Arctium lappa]
MTLLKAKLIHIHLYIHESSVIPLFVCPLLILKTTERNNRKKENFNQWRNTKIYQFQSSPNLIRFTVMDHSSRKLNFVSLFSTLNSNNFSVIFLISMLALQEE